jgi:hypothetical protein
MKEREREKQDEKENERERERDRERKKRKVRERETGRERKWKIERDNFRETGRERNLKRQGDEEKWIDREMKKREEKESRKKKWHWEEEKRILARDWERVLDKRTDWEVIGSQSNRKLSEKAFRQEGKVFVRWCDLIDAKKWMINWSRMGERGIVWFVEERKK